MNRKPPPEDHPAIVALRNAPRDTPFELTEEDRARLKEIRQRIDRGEEVPTISQETIEAHLETRRVRELLDQALVALHDIGGARQARKFLATGVQLTAPLQKSMEAKALTDEGIEKLALETWEAIAIELQKP